MYEMDTEIDSVKWKEYDKEYDEGTKNADPEAFEPGANEWVCAWMWNGAGSCALSARREE